MKKSLLALAVLGAFTGVASAQSSVTVYGKVDIAYGHKGNADINVMADSGAGSRLGFKGVEDLGGGLKATFQIEHRFNPDDGTVTSSGKMWHGLSTVGLSDSKLGSINFGRQYTATFSLIQNQIDPFKGDGYANLRDMGMMVDDSVGGSTAGSSTTKAGLAVVRFDNSLRYDYSGYGVNFGITVGERANNGTTDFTYNDSTPPIAVAANYTVGGLFVGLGLENPEGDGNYLTSLGARYDFGSFVASAGFAKGKINKPDVTGDKADATGWLIGARVPMGKADLKLGFASSHIDGKIGTTTATVAALDKKLRKAAIGVDYNLSKRSKVYADYARYSGDAADSFVNKNAFLVGIQHNF